MILNFKQLEDLVKANNYKLVRLYSGLIKTGNLSDYQPFETIGGENSETVLLRINEIRNLIGGQFTLALGDGRTNQPIKQQPRVMVELTPTATPLNAPPQNQPAFNATELRAQIMREIRADLDKEAKEKEIEEMREELERMKTAGGKFTYILEQFVTGYFGNMMTSAAPMQGPPDEMPTAESDKGQALNNALGVLVKELGPQTIIKLADKFESGAAAGIIPMVKNFANN